MLHELLKRSYPYDTLLVYGKDQQSWQMPILTEMLLASFQRAE
jgi:hypothetical protein